VSERANDVFKFEVSTIISSSGETERERVRESEKFSVLIQDIFPTEKRSCPKMEAVSKS